MADETARSGVVRDSGNSEISSPPDEPTSEGERLSSSSSTADTDPPSEDWSDALQTIVRTQPQGATPAAGKLVTDLLEGHPHYLDTSLVVPTDLAGLGLRRSAVGHLTFAQEQWDTSVSPVLTGRRVILAMALDPAVGRPLVESGVVASLVKRWRPKIRTGDEQKRLIWDLLSDQGRQLADEQPLLAAALGAPSE